ncbi:MAG TPA: hypothetical protein VFQ41_08350 [Candidatus Angelobacter sp.]|nr:hypothetical protein [Candidatus Angelobacter sp.]
MKSKVFSALLLFSSLSLMAQDNTHIVQHQNGLFATVSAFATGETRVSLNVSRGTDPLTGQASTLVFFDTFVETDDGFTDTFGAGTIPDNAISGDDPAHVVLDIDTSQVTTLTVTTCTFSFGSFTESCGPAPAGTIHLEWRQTKIFNAHTSTDSQQTFSQVRINFHLVSDSASANVTGSLLGLDINTGDGSAGVNHNSVVTITRTN